VPLQGGQNGASALELQRVLGLKSYETAWVWLHKFRRTMIRAGRELLSGRVEVDECYTGSPEDKLRGQGNVDKTFVVIAVQEDRQGIGRICFRQIPDASADSLNLFLQDSIEPGGVIHTDSWKGYSSVGSLGYTHEVTVLKGKKESASELLPRVHIVISS
jgi:hypothetical protein